MKKIQNIGLGLFLIGLTVFTSLIFLGKYEVTPEILNQAITNNGIKSELFIKSMNEEVVGKEYTSIFSFSSKITTALKDANTIHKQNSEWDKVIWSKPHSLSYGIAKSAGAGIVKENKSLFWFLSFGLGILGSLLFIIPNVITLGSAGIKNNGVFLNAATNRG